MPALNENERTRLRVIENDGIQLITDGAFACRVTMGRYSIKPFRNPSGELVPKVSGYRPKGSVGKDPAGNIQSGSNGGQDTKQESDARRVRKNNFNNLEQADGYRDELLREDGNAAKRFHLVQTELNADQVRDAEKAVVMMLQLPEPDWTKSKWTLSEVVDYVIKHFQPCTNPKPLAIAVTEFIDSEEKANLRFGTMDTKKTSLGRLVKACPSGCMVHQVSSELLHKLIHSGTKKSTWKRYKSDFSTFFDWASDRERGHCPSNPVKLVKLQKRKDDYKVPTILPNSVVVNLLQEAQAFKGGRLFLFCVIAIVAALRLAELARIQALRKILGIESFKFRKSEPSLISVIGKTRQLRDVKIPDEFVPIVQTYVEAGYPIIPRGFAHDWTTLRARIGFLGRKDLIPDYLFSQQLQEWESDVLRHVGITHHLNRSKNEHETALWAGNSPGMIFKHYKGKASDEETREFYGIADKLRIPDVEDLKKRGIPLGATDAELKRLKCPVNIPNTFFMDKDQFERMRRAFLVKCPEAAIPESKRPTRENVWTKRRTLPLPEKREDLLLLVYTKKLEELAEQYGVTRGTLTLAFADRGIEVPPVGYWQKRAAGVPVTLPEEVARLFPEGLPEYSGPVGRKSKVIWPPLDDFLKQLWKEDANKIGPKLGCSGRTVLREAERQKLPTPAPWYWHQKPELRGIPLPIRYLFALNAKDLHTELDKKDYRHWGDLSTNETA